MPPKRERIGSCQNRHFQTPSRTRMTVSISTTKKKHDWLSKRSAYDDDAGAYDDRSCSADDDDRVVLLKIPSSAGQYYMLAVVTTPFALGNASVKYAPGND